MYVVANLMHAISVARLCVGNGWADMSVILLDAVRAGPTLFNGTTMMPASVLPSFATVKLPLLDWTEIFESGDKRLARGPCLWVPKKNFPKRKEGERKKERII